MNLLQVCPVSVLSNWEMQLEEHVDGSLTFCKYHGSHRSRHLPVVLAKLDIVLTTYGTLVADQGLLSKVGYPQVNLFLVVSA